MTMGDFSMLRPGRRARTLEWGTIEILKVRKSIVTFYSGKYDREFTSTRSIIRAEAEWLDAELVE